MKYSIGEVAKLTGISAYTLRYYEKEGLLSSIARNSNERRTYSENDIELLKIITCLKETGMTIKNIHEYLALCQKGESTVDARLALFKKQRERLLEMQKKLQTHLETANYKIWYYEHTALLASIKDVDQCQRMREIYNERLKDKG